MLLENTAELQNRGESEIVSVVMLQRSQIREPESEISKREVESLSEVLMLHIVMWDRMRSPLLVIGNTA